MRNNRYVLVAGKKALGDAGLAWDGPEIRELDAARAGRADTAPSPEVNAEAVRLRAMLSHTLRELEELRALLP